MSACFPVALSHVFTPSLTVSQLFFNSHLCVYCFCDLAMTFQCSPSRCFVCVDNTDRQYDAVLFFYGRRSSLTHRCHLALRTRQTAWITSTNHSWIDVCACVFTGDICVFPWGVGEWAASGASDWPTGMGGRQDADWIDV